MSKELRLSKLLSSEGDGERENERLVTGGERMAGVGWSTEVRGVGRLKG